MKIKAPQITSLQIKTLSANHLHLVWDDVGANFYYLVELTSTRTQTGQMIPENKLQWRSLGHTSDPFWFDESVISADNYYKVRVSTAASGFLQSNWVESEEFLSFKENAYTITKDRKLTLSKEFVERKFIKNDRTYIDFNNNVFSASLMGENYVYSPLTKNVDSVVNNVLYEDEYHEIQGNIEKVCKDQNRVFLGEIDGLLYLFEKYQKMVKVSNDKGQTWHYYEAFDDRVGNPVYRNVLYQNSTTSYVLGYDRVFYGRMIGDLRWSSDEVRFSNTDETFTKSDESLGIDFNVHLFGTYAYLPGDISKYAESMAASDTHVYVAGRNTLRFLDIENAPLDMDQSSHSYGKRLFSDDKITIVPGNNKVVVSKLDVVDGKLYALITGQAKKDFADLSVVANVVPSKDSGVYEYNQDQQTFTRVYGNTRKEREIIEHGETSMSTNGKTAYISYTSYKYEYSDEQGNTYKTVVPSDDYPYLLDKKKFIGSLVMDQYDSKKWTRKPSKYYGEAWFNWLAKSGNRSWINNDNDIVIVYPFKLHQKQIEVHGAGSVDRIMAESTSYGATTIYCPNISFDEFKDYAGGVLIHTYDGEVIGYYEFNYRVKNEVDIIWKPKHVMFTAELAQQEHNVEWKPATTDGFTDPDLRPFLGKMGPDSYILDNTNFEKFSKYYLEFVSNGKTTAYNKLLNLIKLKYPREEDAYEYLWSELNRRNIYLDKEKKDKVVRFFETHARSFYSSKGVEASYKFLFKALYNEDVEIETESKAGLEYDIEVTTDNINQDIVGTTVYTKTGRCNVTYIEKTYVDTKPVWVLTIHNMIGRFYEGQELLSETSGFTGSITRGIKGKELFDNSIDYINRNRSYYVMKIRSSLPTSRYANDILRFVHPTGFGFIGITILTMFINSGLSMKHVETTIDRLLSYRVDMGSPIYWPDRVLLFDYYDEPVTDTVTGDVVYALHPNAGKLYLENDEAKYNKEHGFVGVSKPAKTAAEWIKNVSPWDRRSKFSPTIDQSGLAVSNFRKLSSMLIDESILGFDPKTGYLKDNVGNPRDPNDPTQEKIED